jgi:flagellar basal body-associated protein FliL
MCRFVPVDVTHIPPTTVTTRSSEEMLGVNATIIGISVAVVLLIVVGVVASVAVIVIITVVIKKKKKKDNRFEGKTAINATQVIAENGVGKL